MQVRAVREEEEVVDRERGDAWVRPVGRGRRGVDEERVRGAERARRDGEVVEVLGGVLPARGARGECEVVAGGCV